MPYNIESYEIIKAKLTVSDPRDTGSSTGPEDLVLQAKITDGSMKIPDGYCHNSLKSRAYSILGIGSFVLPEGLAF